MLTEDLTVCKDSTIDKVSKCKRCHIYYTRNSELSSANINTTCLMCLSRIFNVS